MSPLVVPAGFNGNGYVFGGPVAGEIFGFDWGPGADVYLGTIRFWDEPITPFGFAPLAVDFSSTLAAAATSAAVTANCMGAWLRGIQYVYQASQTSTPVAMLSDGTGPGGVFSSIGTGTLGVTIQASASQLALANSLTFKTTNNGAVNMTYFWRVMGLFGA
jgi:hypothetical protein